MHGHGASSSFPAPVGVARSRVNIRPYTLNLGWTQSLGAEQHHVWLPSDAVASTLIPSPWRSSPMGSVSQRSICLTRKVPASSILMLSYKQTRLVRVEWSGGDWGNNEDRREGVAARPPPLPRRPPLCCGWALTVAALNIQQEIEGGRAKLQSMSLGSSSKGEKLL